MGSVLVGFHGAVKRNQWNCQFVKLAEVDLEHGGCAEARPTIEPKGLALEFISNRLLCVEELLQPFDHNHIKESRLALLRCLLGACVDLERLLGLLPTRQYSAVEQKKR